MMKNENFGEYVVPFVTREGNNYRNSYLYALATSIADAVDIAKNEFRKNELTARITGGYVKRNDKLFKVFTPEKSSIKYRKTEAEDTKYQPMIFWGKTLNI